MNANRICIIGCSGGGKTTHSQQIAAKAGMAYFSIDRDVRWLPNWKPRERLQQRAILTQLVQQERWVMDGSGPSSFDIRLPRTELILWVRIPRYLALLGLAKRVVRYFGSVRPAMAEGCPEPLPNKEFLSYIWNFETETVPKFIRNIDLFGPDVPVAVLKSHRDIDGLLQMLEPSSPVQ